MRTIEVDDGLYEFLLRSSSRFGESPSDVLRRLLKFPVSGNGQNISKERTAAGPAGQNVPRLEEKESSQALLRFLNSPAFLVHGNVVGRFRAVLSWLCRQDPAKFEKVLLFTGRKRRYFAKSSSELEEAGNSVMPKRIPDTPYWVITNSPTQLKKQIVADVMRVLGYDESQTRIIVDGLG